MIEVPRALVMRFRTPNEALTAAKAINEARVFVAVDLGPDNAADARLYAVEMAYYRRADELQALEDTKTLRARDR